MAAEVPVIVDEASDLGWFNYVERFQSGLGALLGLFVLSGVAYYNARETRNRDKERREEDKRALAAELAGELAQVRHELEVESKFLKLNMRTHELIGEALDLTKHGRIKRDFPAFDANAGRLGLLDPGTVVRLVKIVRNIRHLPDLAEAAADNPNAMIGQWADICMSAAESANELTRELAAIANLDLSDLDPFPMFGERSEDENTDSGTRESSNGNPSE